MKSPDKYHRDNVEYGRAHRKKRAQVKVLVDAGRAICWRCQKPIRPGSAWDLGHDDHDRSIYNGPEHSACNRATAGRPATNPTDTSRIW